MRYQIIANPASAHGAAASQIPELRRLLDQHRLDYDLVLTERPWHAAELAQQAVRAGADVVVAAGGDGTANEVLNGLMLAKQAGAGLAALGVLCIGRGNDFAFGMGIPADLAAGVQVLAQAHRRSIDVGRATGGFFPQGRFFGNGVGVGFDAVVGFEAAKMTHLRGFASYAVAALKTISLYPNGPHVEVRLNGSSTVSELSGQILMVSVMNGRRMGGGFMMAPNGVPSDGQFDICLARQVSRPQILMIIPRFMQGTQAGHPAIIFERTSHLRLTAIQGVLPAHMDGETLSVDARELELELLPAQLDILTTPPEVAS